MPRNVPLDDRRFGRAEKIGRRQQLKQRRLLPHTEQPPAREPARRLHHQNAAAVDHPESKHHGRRCGRSVRAKSNRSSSSRVCACTEMGDRSSCPWRAARRRRAFDLRERREDQPADFARSLRWRDSRTSACWFRAETFRAAARRAVPRSVWRRRRLRAADVSVDGSERSALTARTLDAARTSAESGVR